MTNRQIIVDPVTKTESINTSRDGNFTDHIRFASFDSAQPGSDAYTLLPDTPSAANDFFLKLHADMTGDDGGDVLIFFHGFECDWPCGISNLRDMERQHINAAGSKIKHIIGFSWPSEGDLLKYHQDELIAQASGNTAGHCFKLLIEFFSTHFPPSQNVIEPCNRKIHLICHSMGNQVLQNMIASINFQSIPYLGVFEEIILVAADIDNDAFEKDADKTLYSLNNMCRRVHIYCNRADSALLISDSTKHHFKRLGMDGPANLNVLPSHIYVIDTTDVKDEVDDFFKDLKDEIIHHWYYKTVPKVVADIQSVLNGQNDEDIHNRQITWPGVKYRIKQ